MGINDEYSRDAYYEESWDSDDSPEEDNELHPEDWEITHSEELSDGWATFQEYIHDNFLSVKRSCNLTKFIDLVIHPHMYISIYNPSLHAVEAWNRVKRVPVIRDRVAPENFYTWFYIYVNYD